MRSGKLTNTFLALLAHLVAPLLAAKEAAAVGKDSMAPDERTPGAAPAGGLKLEADQRRRESL